MVIALQKKAQPPPKGKGGRGGSSKRQQQPGKEEQKGEGEEVMEEVGWLHAKVSRGWGLFILCMSICSCQFINLFLRHFHVCIHLFIHTHPTAPPPTHQQTFNQNKTTPTHQPTHTPTPHQPTHTPPPQAAIRVTAADRNAGLLPTPSLPPAAAAAAAAAAGGSTKQKKRERSAGGGVEGEGGEEGEGGKTRKLKTIGLMEGGAGALQAMGRRGGGAAGLLGAAPSMDSVGSASERNDGPLAGRFVVFCF